MITIRGIITSGGKFPEREAFFTSKHRRVAEVLVERVNGLLSELGEDISDDRINEGFRLQWAKYGAPMSWHKRGGAVDFSDDHVFSFAHKITRVLLLKHKLRREDTDYTQKKHQDGVAVFWCHLDLGQPHGAVFAP